VVCCDLIFANVKFPLMFSRDVLREMIDQLIDGMVVIDAEGTILSVNPAMVVLFGYAEDELVGQNVRMLMPEPYHSQHDNYIRNYHRTGERHVIGGGREVVAKRKNGSMFPIFLNVNELVVEGKKVFAGVIHDISGRKLAETAFRETDNKLKAILATAVEGMIIMDQRGRMELVNPAALRLFGYEENEVIGMNVKMLMPEPDHSAHDDHLKRYKETGRKSIIGVGREVIGRRKDGMHFPFSLSVSEVELRDRTMYVGMIHDLTLVKQVQRDLEVANAGLNRKVEERTHELERINSDLMALNERLETEIRLRTEAEENALAALEKEKHLNEMKSRFVSMASHEFRTPLSGILTSVSLLTRYTAPEHADKRDKHIATIKTSVHNLTSILNDFLSLDKLEEGKVSVNINDFPIHPMLDEFKAEMMNNCKHGQNIVFEFDGQVDIVRADRHLFKNILINLVSNALKYSGEGQLVRVCLSMEHGNLRVDVIDQGIGIPEKDQPQMFERLFRASNALNIQGTGLGLNIVKKYIDLHNGSIAFHSEQGRGTTFTITIPQ
jgi:two-component system, LuxR family, sensor kinase FixL